MCRLDESVRSRDIFPEPPHPFPSIDERLSEGLRDQSEMTKQAISLIDANTPRDRYILVWHKSYSSWKSATWNKKYQAYCSGKGILNERVYSNATHWTELPELPGVSK